MRESGGEGMEGKGKAPDEWIVGGHRFTSRLLMGTGKFQDAETMVGAVIASGAQIVTVALRRVGRNPREDDMLGPLRGAEGDHPDAEHLRGAERVGGDPRGAPGAGALRESLREGGDPPQPAPSHARPDRDVRGGDGPRRWRGSW